MNHHAEKFKQFENVNATRDLSGMTFGNLTVRAETLDPESRSVEAILSTERVTEVFDWARFEVIDEVLRADGFEISGEQVPLLNNHRRFDLDQVLGSVRNIRQENDQVIGRLFLADGDEMAERAWNKLKQGHLTDVSVGYRARGSETLKPGETKTIQGKEYTADNGRTLRVTTAWPLKELSLTPIGADEAAKIRSEISLIESQNRESDSQKTHERGMAEMSASQTNEGAANTESPENSPLVTIDVDNLRTEAQAEGRKQGAAAERARVQEIRELAGTDTPAELVERAVNDDWTVDQAAREFLGAVRNARPETVPSAPAAIIRDKDQDINRDVLVAALCHRMSDDYAANVAATSPAFSDAEKEKANQVAERAWRFRDFSLLDIARESVKMDQARDPLSNSQPHTRSEIIRAAVSTASFSNIMTTNVNARLQRAYSEAADTTDWCSESDVADFKTNERPQMGKDAGLKKLPSGATADHAKYEDNVESYKIARYANQFVMDEQDIINDNLGAVARIPTELGRASARLRPDLVYSILLANANMGDGTALFAAGHGGNTATAALSLANIKARVANMAKQTRDSVVLNINAAYLVTGRDLEFDAREYLGSQTQIVDGSSSQTFRGTRNVVSDLGIGLRVDHRISGGVTDPDSGTAHTASTTAWFLAANPADVETVEVAYLAGTGRRPVLRRFNLIQGQWGVGWDINLDIGAKALDFRGLDRGNT